MFDGTFDEGKKAELLRQLEDQLRKVKAKEKASKITNSDKSKLIILLEEPIKYNKITPEKAQQLIHAVTTGQLPLTEAYRLVENLIKDINT